MENGEAPGEAVRRANLMENCQGLPRAMGYDWQRAMLMENGEELGDAEGETLGVWLMVLQNQMEKHWVT